MGHPSIWGYAFAGAPLNKLNAGGLGLCIEDVEQLAILEHDPHIQLRKEGVFLLGSDGGAEQITDTKIHLSDQLTQEGITDNWFQNNRSFGNGTSVSKTLAHWATKVVNHECGRTPQEILKQDGVLDYSRLVLKVVHDFSESWAKYERRWRAGTCPQENHAVQMTVIVTKHELPAFAYNRILDMVERGALPLHPELYISLGEPGRYMSEPMTYNGESGYQEVANALPGF